MTKNKTSHFKFTLLILWLASLGVSFALPLAPAMTGYVVDQAKLLRDPDQLARDLEAIFKAGGPQIAVLTIEDLDGEAIESWSLSVARAWHLGQSSKGDGILIVIAKEEREVRVEVGSGLEERITPPIARDLIHKFMLPEFRVGRFQHGVEGAIYRALEEIPNTTEFQKKLPASWQLTPGTNSWASGEPIFVGLFFLILIFSIFRGSTRQTRGRRYSPVDGFDGQREYWSNRPNSYNQSSHKPATSTERLGAGGSFGGGGASGSW